jgi:hypothetical protein
MITIVSMLICYKYRPVLVSLSHTFLDGFALPLGMTKAGRIRWSESGCDLRP